MNLIIITEEDRIDENYFKISDDRFDHIVKILKPEIGDLLEIGFLNGPTGKAKIVELKESFILLATENLIESTTTDPQIDIICALNYRIILLNAVKNIG